MDYGDMDGMGAYVDEDGNIVYPDHEMMGSEDEDGQNMHGDSYGHEGSPGYGDVRFIIDL